jgi:hypothetical protein
MQITQAQNKEELLGILALQQANLPSNISKEEAISQGFVTVIHDLPLLQRMNDAAAHTIAKEGNEVIGYCLSMLPSFREEIPVLVPMFDMIDTLNWRAQPLSQTPYFVMGQTCVAKSHRGKGVFNALYLGLKDFFKADFDVVITEISKRNLRSWRAHQRVGFELIHEYEDPSGEIWLVVGWSLSDFN